MDSEKEHFNREGGDKEGYGVGIGCGDVDADRLQWHSANDGRYMLIGRLNHYNNLHLECRAI